MRHGNDRSKSLITVSSLQSTQNKFLYCLSVNIYFRTHHIQEISEIDKSARHKIWVKIPWKIKKSIRLFLM